ncbi:dynein regulatory complex subunit 3 [Teleopsis dalmanni]|uniref:dynein regulatory complex subunit 3 n=1 Tax=Teleopsis dalmanni TaxID=139649 RepID=UPI000D32AA08|nr:dynein regulatory complex subunit 3 [Teleopsis dalmanni]
MNAIFQEPRKSSADLFHFKDTTEMDSEKQDYKSPIIYPEIEPGIIGKEMIEKIYFDEKYTGEKATLHKLQPMVYERVTEMCFEFKNLLRIDHLWVLPNLTKLSLCWNKLEEINNIDMLVNLKHLDLSFNHIKKIENIEKLVQLEQLSLFNNLITILENVDKLPNLIILSVGNNLIETIEGIDRLRFLTNLRAFNLEGNPMAKTLDFFVRDYCIAILPKLNYYEYKPISDEEREIATKKFAQDIRRIENREEGELSIREKHIKDVNDYERYSKCFVENLNENQLYQSFWENDEDGKALLLGGPGVSSLVDNYNKSVFDITQEIFKLGLKHSIQWDSEVQDFHTCLEEGAKEMQVAGQGFVEEFLEYKIIVFDKALELLKQFQFAEAMPESKTVAQYEDLSTEFDDSLNILWQELMANELHLHESIAEASTNFVRSLKEMMSKFVEECQIFFAQLRETIVDFTEDMNKEVSNFINLYAALHDLLSIPEELRECAGDYEALTNLLTGMKDTHAQKVDEREDLLITRTKQFVESTFQNLVDNETKRNRQNILEINNFIDLMHEGYANLVDELHDDDKTDAS